MLFLLLACSSPPEPTVLDFVAKEQWDQALAATAARHLQTPDDPIAKAQYDYLLEHLSDKSAEQAAFYQVACLAGDKDACLLKVQLDVAPADQGDPCLGESKEACFAAARERIRGAVTAEEQQFGIDALVLLCGHQYPLACATLGDFHLAHVEGGEHIPEGLSLHQTACHQGIARSCYAVGRSMLKGFGMPQDVEGGIALVQAACQGGYEPACDQSVMQ